MYGHLHPHMISYANQNDPVAVCNAHANQPAIPQPAFWMHYAPPTVAYSTNNEFNASYNTHNGIQYNNVFTTNSIRASQRPFNNGFFYQPVLNNVHQPPIPNNVLQQPILNNSYHFQELNKGLPNGLSITELNDELLFQDVNIGIVPHKYAGPSKVTFLTEIHNTEEMFDISIDVSKFTVENIVVKVGNGFVVVQAKHVEVEDMCGYVSREFTRRCKIPFDVDVNTFSASVSANDVLCIKASKKVNDFVVMHL